MDIYKFEKVFFYNHGLYRDGVMPWFCPRFSQPSFLLPFCVSAMAGSEETEWLEELLAYNRHVAIASN